MIRLKATGEGCPDQAAFARAVDQAVRAGESTSEPRLDFDIELDATPSEATGFVLLGGHRRSLRGRTCLEVAEGLALIVVVSIDPTAAALSPVHIVADDEPQREREPPPPPELGEPPPRRVSRPEAPSRPPPRGSFVAPLVAATTEVGGLPPNVGISIGAILGFPSVWRSQLVAEASAFDVADVHVAGGTVQWSAWSGRFAACPWVLVWSGLEFAPCAGVALIHASTQSRGFPVDAATSHTWVAASLEARGRLSLGPRLGVFASAAALATAGPARWTLQSYGDVFTASAVTGELAAGVDVRF